MKRRTLLWTSGLSFIGLQLGLLAGCGREGSATLATPVEGEAAANALKRLAAGLHGVEFVGPVCADHGTADRPLMELLDRLRASGEPEIGPALAMVIASDVTAGRVIDINGWQFAESECLLLAAAAGLQGLGSARRAETDDLVFEDFAEVERWGPRETIEGRIFNPAGNGRGGLWVRVAEPAPAATRLVFGGVELTTHFEPGVITASLEPEHTRKVITNPGLYEVLMVDTARGIAQRVGHLTVRPMPPKATLDDGRQSEVFCKVERWGPDHAPQGQAFNEQPDGSAAFWVRIGCAPESAELVLSDTPLPTTVSSGIVTARVPHYAELATGEHKLTLHDPESGETLTVGTMSIL